MVTLSEEPLPVRAREASPTWLRQRRDAARLCRYGFWMAALPLLGMALSFLGLMVTGRLLVHETLNDVFLMSFVLCVFPGCILAMQRRPGILTGLGILGRDPSASVPRTYGKFALVFIILIQCALVFGLLIFPILWIFA